MPSFDDDYLARREKQIQDVYMLGAMTLACFATSVILAIIAAVLMTHDRDVIGTILLVVALLFGVGSLFMVASYFGQKAADRAVQKEVEQLVRYGARLEKRKRIDQDDMIPMTDDGEMLAEDDLDTLIRTQDGRGR